MGESDTPDYMAFGEDERNGFKCPAFYALDHIPHSDHLQVAEMYDELVAEEEGAPSGVIEAEQAEEYWDQTIARLKELSAPAPAMDAANEIKREAF